MPHPPLVSVVAERLRPVLVSLIGLALLAAPAAAQGAAKEPTPKEIERAWSFLLPAEQREVVEWMRLEVSVLESFQGKLIRYLLGGQDVDAGTWPLDAPPDHYDPKVHAKKQPIERRWLEPDSRTAARERRRLLGEPNERDLRSGWRYDWATGELRRRVETDEQQVERHFRNALQGYPPDLDLARALLLRELDRGEERKKLAAFAHAYTDRAGQVYPGLTLYDALNSGVTIEMPDVDTLGIVHDVLNDWRKWKAPVPERRQKSLYAKVGDLFQDAARYRNLREALADCFLIGSPVPRNGYGESTARFHALWEKHGSDPSLLAEDLPTPRKWERYLKDWAKHCRKDAKVLNEAKRRQQTLDYDAWRVRQRLLWVLGEYGAFERERRPDPPPPEPERKPGGGEGD